MCGSVDTWSVIQLIMCRVIQDFDGACTRLACMQIVAREFVDGEISWESCMHPTNIIFGVMFIVCF